MTGRRFAAMSRFNIASLALGFAFLYLPIVILVIYSFNASQLVTVWGGWSLRWYTAFFNDEAMLAAAATSLRVAAVSATLAAVLGTLAALALVRGERFKGRTLFSGMLYAPLVMPEVITGLSLLLLFVALGAERPRNREVQTLRCLASHRVRVTRLPLQVFGKGAPTLTLRQLLAAAASPTRAALRAHAFPRGLDYMLAYARR